MNIISYWYNCIVKLRKPMKDSFAIIELFQLNYILLNKIEGDNAIQQDEISIFVLEKQFEYYKIKLLLTI